MTEAMITPAAADDLLLREDAGGIATLTLNAPKSINALSEAMLDALIATLDDIAADRSVKAVILRTGGKHFCAGHNLKEMSQRRQDADGGFQYFQELFATCSSMIPDIVHVGSHSAICHRKCSRMRCP